MYLPSLLHSAELELGPPSVRRRGVAPRLPVSSSQMPVRPLLASMSVARWVNATRFPEGDTATSEIRSMRTMSWIVKGSVGSAGEEAAAAPATPAMHQRLRAGRKRWAGMVALLVEVPAGLYSRSRNT